MQAPHSRTAFPVSVSLRALAALLAAAIQLPAQSGAAAKPLPPDRAKGAGTVDEAQCREWLGVLASPEFEGRGTGQEGFQKAADYVAAHFAALKLEARGDGGTYFQRVPWKATKVVADKTSVTFTKDGTEVVRIPAANLAGTVSNTMSAAGDVVLLVVTPPPKAPRTEGRRGFEVPTIAGLEAVDATDKIVVVFVLEGDDSSATTPMVRLAVQQGLQGKSAAAVLFAQTDAVHGGLRGRSGMGRGGNPAAAGARRAPVDATFGGNDLKMVLAAAGKSAAQLDGKTLAIPLPLAAKVEIATDEGDAPAMNVFAVLPGSDPKLKDEYVVIGSHLDHLGKRGDRIHPGADDDGSGTTGVMAVAKMFATNPTPPKRSILFVCFCGEEVGLVGSGYFAKNCPVPLSSIVGELQMDMIGRDEEESAEGNKGEKAEDNRNSVHLVGTQKISPALHELCLAKNAAAGFDIEYDEERMFGRSDHANFARMGVPIAFFFTGLHRDYHQPSDTPDKIHYAKLLRVARWVYDIAFDLATNPDRPHVDPAAWAKYRDKATEQPAAPLAPKAAGSGG